MERNKPYYSLSKAKLFIKCGSYLITRKAVEGARIFGLFNETTILKVILEIKMKDFYKSMESLQCPGTWQDVYQPLVGDKQAYIKLQIEEDAKTVVIQFKERGGL